MFFDILFSYYKNIMALAKVRVYGHVLWVDDLVKASWEMNDNKWIIHTKDIIKRGRDMLIDILHAPEFKYASIGTCNRKWVMKVKKRKWALVNNKWEEVTEFKYDDIAANYFWNFFVSRITWEWKSLLDSDWIVITKDNYKYICPTCNLEKYWIAARVTKEQWGKSRLIDFDGNLLWKWYDFIDDEADQYWLIRVSNGKGWDERFWAINPKWEEVIPLIYKRNIEFKYDIEEFGKYKIVKCKDAMGLFDRNLKCLVPVWELKKIYHSLWFFEVVHNWKKYLFDNELRLKFNDYDSLEVWVMGESWKVQKNGEIWLFDSNFRELIPIKYINVQCFSFWYAVAQKSDGSFSIFDLRKRREIDAKDFDINTESLPEENWRGSY